jgi:hypothetical protein
MENVGSERSGTVTPTTQEQDLTAAEPEVRQPMWELAECTCPEWCERDHETD